jgi:surface-anchored protein
MTTSDIFRDKGNPLMKVIRWLHVDYLARQGLMALAISLLGVAPAWGGLLYTFGHGDIGVAYEEGELELHWHLGPTAVVDGSPVGNPPDGEEFGPGDITAFVAGPPIMRPAGSAWDPIGNNAGDSVWYLPQTGAAATSQGKPFLGLATEELTGADWSGFLWTITNVSGPGQFSIWQDGITPTFFAASSNGLPDNFSGPPLGGHDHFNLGFTAEGIYDITFQVSGNHAVDGFKSDSGVFQFAVGASAVPEPSTLLVVLIGGAVSGVSASRRMRRQKMTSQVAK